MVDYLCESANHDVYDAIDAMRLQIQMYFKSNIALHCRFCNNYMSYTYIVYQLS